MISLLRNRAVGLIISGLRRIKINTASIIKKPLMISEDAIGERAVSSN